MFCRNCGAQLPDNVSFCPNCGTVVPKPAVQQEQPKPENTVKQQSPAQGPSAPQGMYAQSSSQIPPQGQYTQTRGQTSGQTPPQNRTYTPYSAPSVQSDPADGTATGSVVLGVLGLIGSWIPLVKYFTLICSIVAIILGAVARKKEKALGLPTGKATAGLVLGIIGVSLTVLLLLACVACAGWLASTGSFDPDTFISQFENLPY